MLRAFVFALVMMLGTAAGWADDTADCDQTRNLDLKIRGCSKLIKLSPNDATAYTNRGVTYERKGEVDRTIADLQKALEIDPSDQDAKEGLKRLGVTP